MNTATRTRAHETMAALTFGVEVETYGLGIARAAAVVAAAIGGTVREVGGYYDAIAAVGPDGREWLAMHDGSIEGSGGAEVVSPILRGETDIALLQTVVRALRAAGGRSDAAHQCGIHVHVGVGHLDVAVVGRVAKTTAKLDEFIRAATGVSAGRDRWCRALHRPTLSGHVANLPAIARARTWDALGRAWYGSERDLRDARSGAAHYHGSRYHGLNLHSLFYRNRGTVEFRYFDGTMHAGRIRAYVTLCLAIVARSVVQSAASAKVRRIETAKEATNLLSADLGLVGAQFATTRQHLTAAWVVAALAEACRVLSAPARATEAA